MAEFEFAGTTFRGGKMFAVLTALSTLGGGLWAGFEFYKDYMDMKEIVQNIDVDAIAAENAKVMLKMDEQMLRIEEAIEYTRDIKSDLRQDVLEMEKLVERLEDKTDASEDRVKDSQNSIEATLEGVRNEMNQVQKDVSDCKDQRASLDNWNVTACHRVHHQLTDTWINKDHLNNDNPDDKVGKVKRNHRGDWFPCVRQRMFQDDFTLRCAGQAGHLNIRVGQKVDNGRTRHAHHVCHNH